jgi:hypothetical protein
VQQLSFDNAEYPHRIKLFLSGPSAIFVPADNQQCKILLLGFKPINIFV